MEGKEIPRGQRGAGRARAAGGARATHLGGQGRDGGGAAGGSWRCAKPAKTRRAAAQSEAGRGAGEWVGFKVQGVG